MIRMNHFCRSKGLKRALFIRANPRDNGSIYSYNRETGEEKELLALGKGYYQYDVYGNKVVYVDVYGTSGVKMYVMGG